METNWLLVVLGILLILLSVGIDLNRGYVPELADWNYMRIAHVLVPGSVVGKTVVLRFDLPDINESDINSVRVTYGSGPSEKLLTSWVSDDKLYVLFTPPSSSFDLRVYYGNPGASRSAPLFSTSVVYKAPPFDDEDFTVACSGRDCSWGIMRVTRSKLYLLKWGMGSGSVYFPYELRPGMRVDLHLYSRAWGWGRVWISLEDVNTAPVDIYRKFPGSGTGILIDTLHNGRYYVMLYSGGSRLGYFTARGSLDLTLYVGEDKVYVYKGKHLLMAVPRFSYLTIFSTGTARSDDIELRGIKFRYVVVDASVSYSDQLLAPKAPVVRLSPSDGSYLNSHDVHVSVGVSDPNDDLNVVSVYLDGNLVYSGSSSFSSDYNLPDGDHVLRAVAVDLEGIEVNVSSRFTVDTVPPVLDINYELNGSVLHVELNASDEHLDHCYFGSDEIPCSASLDLNVSPGEVLFFGAVDKAGNTTERQVRVPSGLGGSSSGSFSGSSPSGGSSVGSGEIVVEKKVEPVSVTTSSVQTSSVGAPGRLSVSPVVKYVALGSLFVFTGVLVYFVLLA